VLENIKYGNLKAEMENYLCGDELMCVFTAQKTKPVFPESEIQVLFYNHKANILGDSIIKISDESLEIHLKLKTLDGGMTFFSKMIDACENHREGMATMLRAGRLEKELGAIYTLFRHELEGLQTLNDNVRKSVQKLVEFNKTNS